MRKELPLTTQARLLRVLESGEFLKVGSSEVQKTNIRVVAATNVDMADAIARGKFREDLFYRLATVQITVPPLRDRGEDILLLTRKFTADFADKNRTPMVTFTEDAREAFLRYRWPGNVRQLKNVTEQIALFEAGNSVPAGSRKFRDGQDAGRLSSRSGGSLRAGGFRGEEPSGVDSSFPFRQNIREGAGDAVLPYLQDAQ